MGGLFLHFFARVRSQGVGQAARSLCAPFAPLARRQASRCLQAAGSVAAGERQGREAMALSVGFGEGEDRFQCASATGWTERRGLRTRAEPVKRLSDLTSASPTGRASARAGSDLHCQPARILRVGKAARTHLDHADDRPRRARVIEEGAVADPHPRQVALGLGVAHLRPHRPLRSATRSCQPYSLGLGLDQPVGHGGGGSRGRCGEGEKKAGAPVGRRGAR